MKEKTNFKVTSQIISRIYIQESGDLIVTDLWDELLDLVSNRSEGSFDLDDPDI